MKDKSKARGSIETSDLHNANEMIVTSEASSMPVSDRQMLNQTFTKTKYEIDSFFYSDKHEMPNNSPG